MPDTSPPLVENPLFLLDYDGTIAPIVEDPMAAFPHPGAIEVLIELAQKHPIWIVTGRDLGALGQLLALDLPAVGLHGIEWGRVGRVEEERIEASDRDAIRRMRARVPQHTGVVVEDKGALFAVHYRQAVHAAEAEKLLAAWVAEAPPSLDVIWGKSVVELRPRGRTKGEVVTEIMAHHPERHPIYVGDDTTDEDAFRVLRGRGVSVKVGLGATEAAYRLADVENVAKYLQAYL